MRKRIRSLRSLPPMRNYSIFATLYGIIFPFKGVIMQKKAPPRYYRGGALMRCQRLFLIKIWLIWGLLVLWDMTSNFFIEDTNGLSLG